MCVSIYDGEKQVRVRLKEIHRERYICYPGIDTVCCSVCCSVLQCVLQCVSQCVAVCCSMLQSEIYMLSWDRPLDHFQTYGRRSI